jgi:hypothetical protein
MSRQGMDGGLRVVVTGLAVTYPFGGVFWDYVQYALGFARLGHRVLYLEDTGKYCYAPRAQTFVADGTANAARFAAQLSLLAPELQRAWYYRAADGGEFGVPWRDVVEFCRDADLFLHVSAAGVMREEYHAARLVALLDSDPLYTQGALPPGHAPAPEPWRLERHDAFLTLGESIGRPECGVPTGGLRWIPTRQPIVLDCFAPHEVPVPSRRRCFTTV